MPSSKTFKSLVTISRPEFLPANLASLIMGLAWAATPSFAFNWDKALLVALSFGIITAVSAYGAQLNTLSDYELDLRDKRKQHLTQAMNLLGRNIVKSFILVELLISLVLIVLLLQIQWKAALLVMWVAGFFLGYAYSAPPLRLKARSWLALVSLFLVLCFLPILFVYYTFALTFDPLFLPFLFGQAMTVYAIIIPTETRDYFGDKSMNVITFTVRLGLVKSSLLGIILLATGGILSSAAFFVKLISGPYPLLAAFVLVIAFADSIVLKEYRKLYNLSRQHAATSKSDLAEQIVELSANNPKWITIVSQATVLVSVILLASNFLA
jgi:1,4-dihydroxy-2-naphthoate octaprenyltransferase